MSDEIVFPNAESWYVRLLRFANMLDDAHNMLSPVKLNVWAANIGALGTVVGSVFSHINADVWAPLMTWLTQAHTVHYFDKKQRNTAVVEQLKATKL